MSNEVEKKQAIGPAGPTVLTRDRGGSLAVVQGSHLSSAPRDSAVYLNVRTQTLFLGIVA